MKIVFCLLGSFLGFFSFLGIRIFVPIEIQAGTFFTRWWLGNSPSSDQGDSSGDVVIYYTYPEQVQPGENFLLE